MTNTRKLTTIAILTALSVCFVALIHFPIFPAVAFLEYDPADIDAAIAFAEEIAARAERINSGGVDPHIDNMLRITSDGKKLALDPRLYAENGQDEAGNKLSECAKRVFEIWADTADIQGTQIIFCDLGVPHKAAEAAVEDSNS